MEQKPLIVGNWKMYGDLHESIRWATGLKHALGEYRAVDVAVAPPFTSLYSVSVALAETPYLLAAQNMFWEDEGAYTGEVSGKFLKNVGCHFVILGHSERRQHFDETDAVINLKLQSAVKNELVPILCIGESRADRDRNFTLEVLEKQLKASLRDITIHDFEHMAIAYEPVWAIGSGQNATPAQAGEVHQFIRHWLKRHFDGPTANRIRILYGGSVRSGNAAALMREPHVDGLLVGGASIRIEEFIKIVKFDDKASAS